MKDYDADLSKCKVGDWVWTVSYGWEKVLRVVPERLFPICTKNGHFTFDGKLFTKDNHPSCFITPPSGYGAEPKPCEFKKGDRVLVNKEIW